MAKQKKKIGILLCCLGIFLVKLQNFFPLNKTILLLSQVTGIFISFVGLAVFSSGMNRKIIEKVKICPACYSKNSVDNKLCRKCKNIF